MPISRPARPERWQHHAACWLLWCLYWLGSAAHAALPVEITNTQALQQPSAQWIDFYDPGIQDIGIEDVLALKEHQWRSVRQLPLQLILGIRQTLWLRLALRNSGSESTTLVAENLNPMISSFELMIYSDGRLLPSHTIMPSVHGSHAVRFTVAPDSRVDIYIRSSGFHSVAQPIAIQPEETFRQQKYSLQMAAGLFDGTLFGLMLYNLLLGIKTRQRMYYAHGLMSFSTLLAIIAHQNIFPEQFVLQNGTLLTNIRIIAPMLAVGSLVYFIQVFLQTRTYHPWINRCLSGYNATIPLLVIAFLSGFPPLITTPVFTLLTVIAFGLMIHLCLTDGQHRRNTMILTVIALLLPSAGGLFTVLTSSTIIDSSRQYVISMQAGSAGCMLLLSLAMINRLRQMQDEHARQLKTTTEASIISDAHNRLLAHLNHELRTPLNGILGAAEILLHKSAPRDRHIFNMIHQTALPLKHLVDDMVNIDAITENRKSVHNTRFDLQALLQECMDLFLPVAHAKQIRLFFRVDQDIATDVTGDPNRLRQILLNLLGNACKFTRDGEVGVHVSKRLSAREDRILYHFEVTDTGLGISKADEQRLFQTFETGNPTSNPQGAGLGLSIVRELSELLGGGCGFSTQQAGSRFWFTAALEPHQHIARRTHRAFENLHILIADESRVIGEQLAFQLDSTASDIAIATSKQDIADVLQQTPCDIAVVHLPLADDITRSLILQHHSLLVTYQDQSEALDLSGSHQEMPDSTIVRRTSIEKFSLQIADLLLHRDSLHSARPSGNKKGKHLRILVAEDIPTNQYIIREILTSLSAQPILCQNGREAFALYLEYLLDGKPFDAILMDCEMPIMDGFESTRLIRQYEKENDIAPITIIALTAHTEDAYRHRSDEAGMDLYLTKPITVEGIQRCLQSVENPFT